MDLSSLEGPPLLEHSLARDPPSVHLAALPSLGLPPRPASADAVSRIYALQSQPQSEPQYQSQYQYQAPSHGYSRSQSHLVPYPHLPISHPDDNNNNHTLPPHYRRARTPSPTPISWSSSSPSPDASRRHRPRAPSPQRLVWLDAEKSWVLVSDAQTSVYTPACHGCNCGAGMGAGRESSLNMSGTSSGNGSRNLPSRNGTRTRNASPNLMPPTMTLDPAADLYPPPTVDAPPPYESHVFDKPLVQVQPPGGSRRRGASMQSEFGTDSASGYGSGSGSEGEPSRGRTGGSGSRWTAVARRLRVSPVR